MNPLFHPHLAKVSKAPKVAMPKKTPQMAAKLGKLLGGGSRAKYRGANAPDMGSSLPRPDKVVSESKTGYYGRMPVLGLYQ